MPGLSSGLLVQRLTRALPLPNDSSASMRSVTNLLLLKFPRQLTHLQKTKLIFGLLQWVGPLFKPTLRARDFLWFLFYFSLTLYTSQNGETTTKLAAE